MGIARRHLGHDPRVAFHLAEGAAFLERSALERYDLIYADTCDRHATRNGLRLLIFVLMSVRDTNPSLRTDRTLSAGDAIVKTRGRQTLRFGGDYRDIHADSRTDANARGSFAFTGLYTGSDLADFLLGLPQQATAQYGPGLEQFRSRSWDLFVQDDWRAADNVTISAGLRYEYFSPISEARNRLVTLDTAPGFSAAVPVAAGGTGPFSGALPDSIVRPFRAGFEPPWASRGDRRRGP